jgi:hypothetical protein
MRGCDHWRPDSHKASDGGELFETEVRGERS